MVSEKYKLKIKSGFTLVELLVVIAIISIITMITVGQFMTARKKAADGQRKADISSLTKALQMYYADYGKFPVSIGGSLSDGGGNALSWGGEFVDDAATPYVYMKVLPEEKKLLPYPPFCYVTDDSGSMYGIFAMLENTVDSQCINTDGIGNYVHCGGNNYCFASVSPNIVVGNLDSYEP